MVVGARVATVMLAVARNGMFAELARTLRAIAGLFGHVSDSLSSVVGGPRKAPELPV